MGLPKLTNEDYRNLNDLRMNHPIEFYTDYTKKFLSQLRKSVRNAELVRISVMGKPRIGKSEVGLQICLFYKEQFNEAFKEGLYSHLDLVSDKDIKFQEIEFNSTHIWGSQSDYIDELRKAYAEKRLVFGQIRQIDESRSSSGGLGSYSDKIDLDNIINIVPKFMQSEIWITPPQFDKRNCYWGINVYQKDTEKKVNYCMLFELLYTPRGQEDFVFRGWLEIPLTTNIALREEYNIKKNA